MFYKESRVGAVDKQEFKLAYLCFYFEQMDKHRLVLMYSFRVKLLNKFCSITNKLSCGGILLLNSFTGIPK